MPYDRRRVFRFLAVGAILGWALSTTGMFLWYIEGWSFARLCVGPIVAVVAPFVCVSVFVVVFGLVMLCRGLSSRRAKHP